jgi:hypothetical protein
MEATRSKWTDERMDEFAERTEENFREVRREIRGVDTGLRSEMNTTLCEARRQDRSELQNPLRRAGDRIRRRGPAAFPRLKASLPASLG